MRAAGNGQLESYRMAGYAGGKSCASEMEARPEVSEQIRTLLDKQAAEVLDLREECRKLAPQAIRELAAVMRSEKHLGSKLDAIRQILDRGYGKPKERAEVKIPTILLE